MRRLPGDERLMAYVLGELSPAEAAEVEARLLVDEKAVEEVESLRLVVGMLDRGMADEKLPSLGDQRRQAVLAGPRPMRIEKSGGWGWGVKAAVKAAAVLAIGLTGVMVTSQMMKTPRTQGGAAGLAQGVQPALATDKREMAALHEPRGAFRFVGSPVVLVSAMEDGAGAEPVILTLHTVQADMGAGAGMAALPRLLDDLRVQTPSEHYKTGPDGPSVDRLETSLFRF